MLFSFTLSFVHSFRHCVYIFMDYYTKWNGMESYWFLFSPKTVSALALVWQAFAERMVFDWTMCFCVWLCVVIIAFNFHKHNLLKVCFIYLIKLQQSECVCVCVRCDYSKQMNCCKYFKHTHTHTINYKTLTNSTLRATQRNNDILTKHSLNKRLLWFIYCVCVVCGCARVEWAILSYFSIWKWLCDYAPHTHTHTTREPFQLIFVSRLLLCASQRRNNNNKKRWKMNVRMKETN